MAGEVKNNGQDLLRMIWGVVVTSLALDYYYNGTTHKLANDFINFVDAQSLPRKYLTFSTSQLTAYKEGELQKNSKYYIRREIVGIQFHSHFKMELHFTT